MNYEIEKLDTINKADEKNLLATWHASVKTTHDFLSDEDIKEIAADVAAALRLVELFCLRSCSEVIAFMGLHEGKIEMLFVHPAYRGKGFGSLLLMYAIEKQKVDYVDVNEQNTQAVGFYEKMGFQVFDKTKLDGQGRPFPLLLMKRNA